MPSIWGAAPAPGRGWGTPCTRLSLALASPRGLGVAWGYELPIAGLTTGGENMRSSWVNDDVMGLILAAMLPANRLAVEVSLATGLRISDVLSLKTDLVQRTQRPYVTDSKTGKTHRVYLPRELRERMLQQAGKIWVWPGRLHPLEQHRTRQAVYKDMAQAVQVMRRAQHVERQQSISPHSARKCAAVRAYQRGGLDAAAAMLQHDPDHPLVTMLYALSDKPDLFPSSKRRSKRSCARSSRKPQSGQE